MPLRRRMQPIERSALAARTVMTRRVTTRLAASRRAYAATREIVDRRSGGSCEICGHEMATEHQHRIRRGAGGSSRNDEIHRPSSLLHLCSRCHVAADNAPDRYENGWSIRRGADVDPATVPVFYRRTWVLLDDEGGRTPCVVG